MDGPPQARWDRAVRLVRKADFEAVYHCGQDAPTGARGNRPTGAMCKAPTGAAGGSSHRSLWSSIAPIGARQPFRDQREEGAGRGWCATGSAGGSAK